MMQVSVSSYGTVEVTPEVASAFDIVAAFMQGNPVRQAGVRFVLP